MKKVIIESGIISLAKRGIKTLIISPGDIITPLAMDKIKETGITISCNEINTPEKSDRTAEVKLVRAAVGCDHTGLRTKTLVLQFLSENSIETLDVGTYNENSCDYPDIAEAVVKSIRDNKADFGILIDTTGAASAMAANKFEGIRAMVCYCPFTAKSAREHSNANVIALGAKTLGDETIKSVLKSFLSSRFLGGKYLMRLEKIKKFK